MQFGRWLKILGTPKSCLRINIAPVDGPDLTQFYSLTSTQKSSIISDVACVSPCWGSWLLDYVASCSESLLHFSYITIICAYVQVLLIIWNFCPRRPKSAKDPIPHAKPENIKLFNTVLLLEVLEIAITVCFAGPFQTWFQNTCLNLCTRNTF